MKSPQSVNVIFLLSLGFSIMSGCEKENPDKPHPVSLEKLSGQVQKGPFLNGTSITIAELNADMGQTGKNFSSQINVKRGSLNVNL